MILTGADSERILRSQVVDVWHLDMTPFQHWVGWDRVLVSGSIQRRMGLGGPRCFVKWGAACPALRLS